MTLTAGCADAGCADAGRADVRAPADRCWRKLVTHAALTERRANAPKIIAENTPRTAERRGGHVPPRAGRRHAASAALGGPQHLLRDAIWRIAGQARATAMTWHPFRVPLPCQIAERRAEPLTATLACRSKAIPACSGSWHRQLSCTESSMPGPVRSGSRARSARTATRATSHAQIRRDNVNETRRQ